MQRTTQRTLVGAIVFASCIAAQYSSRQVLQEQGSRSIPFEQRDVMNIPSPEVVKALVLNYGTFGASVSWISALIYYGDWRANVSVAPPGPQHLIRYGELVEELDPSFFKIYEFVNTTNLHGHLRKDGWVPKDTLEESRVFLERGMLKHPGRHELPYAAGMNYLGYSSKNRTNEERRQEYIYGAKYLSDCAKLESCPDNTLPLIGYMEQRAAELEGKTIDPQARIDFYVALLETTIEPSRRQYLFNELKALGFPPAELAKLERSGIEQLKTSYEAERPYLPLDLWAQVVYPTSTELNYWQANDASSKESP